MFQTPRSFQRWTQATKKDTRIVSMLPLVFLRLAQSLLVLDGLTGKELGQLSILHAYISPAIVPLIVPGDAVCVAGVRSLVLYQLGMISSASMTFDDFCSVSKGTMETKEALKTDSAWITYRNVNVQPCVDDFMLALAEKIILNKGSICRLYTSEAPSAGKLLALLALATVIAY